MANRTPGLAATNRSRHEGFRWRYFPLTTIDLRVGAGARTIGWILLAAAVIGAVVFGLIPSSYVIEEPGPVYNTLGKTTVSGTRSCRCCRSAASQDLPDLGRARHAHRRYQRGRPTNRPNWVDVATAWLDPSQAVIPIDEVYAPQQTVQQSNKEGTRR